MEGKSRQLGTYVLLTIMLFLIVYPGMQAQGYELTDDAVDLTGLNVAVYTGTDLQTVEASRVALVNMYEWMNATVDVLDATQIQNDELDGYEILAMPGGNPNTYGVDLGMDGMNAIRDFVASGGSYFGICGGAMLACRLTSFSGATAYYQLKLFNGTVRGPIGEIDGMTSLTINTSCVGPDLSGVASTTNTLYLGGGYYIPDDGQEMITLATYDVNSQVAIAGSTFGHGTVCLSAVHPEIEENSDRDGTDFLDTYDDADSEWELMLKISLWQIEASTWVTTTETTTSETTSTNSTTPPETPLSPEILVIAGVGATVIVIAVLVIVKKR